MTRTKDAAQQFLTSRRIAVTGVSRTAAGHGGNVVYQRLRSGGYEVKAVNPHATEVEGDPCYPDLASIPGGVDAVVIATRPDHAEATVREAAALGVTQVWIHRSLGGGSLDKAAVSVGRELGLTVIDGGCPLMYGEVSDAGHRIMCRVLTWTGVVPRTV